MYPKVRSINALQNMYTDFHVQRIYDPGVVSGQFLPIKNIQGDGIPKCRILLPRPTCTLYVNVYLVDLRIDLLS